MAKSILQASGSAFAMSANTTNYYYMVGQNNINATEANAQIPIRPAGTLSNLRCRVNSNGVTATSTFRLRKNTANGNQVISIGASTTGTLTDASNTDTIAAGDLCNYSLVTGATGTTIDLTTLSVVHEPSTSTITSTRHGIILQSFTTASVTRYFAFNDSSASATTESTTQTKVKKAGSLKYLQARISANARTTTTTIRTRKNTANGAQSLSIGSGGTGQFEDTTNSDTIAVNDLVNFSYTTGTGTQTFTISNLTTTFESTTSDAMFCSWTNTGVAFSASATYYIPLNSKRTNQSQTSGQYATIFDFVGTFSNLGHVISANATTAASTATLDINGSSSTITASITAGATGTFENTATTQSIASGNYISYKTIVGAGGTLTVRGMWAHFQTAPTLLNDPVNTYVTRFQKNSSGTTNATQDILLPFTPKAIIVYSDGSTADNTASAHYQWIQGFSDGTNSVCIASASEDAVASSSEAGRIMRNDSVFVKLADTTPTTTVALRASCTFGTNKVTFTWAVNDTNATYIHLVAYGGTDITNAKVGTTEIGSGTGLKDYTGLGFNPTAGSSVLFTLNAAGTTGSMNGTNTSAASCFGCAVSSSKQWVCGNNADNVTTPSDSYRFYSNSSCSMEFTVTTGGIDYQASFDSWITDGFKLNVTDAPVLTTRNIAYLVINGGTWDCGTLTSPAFVTGNQDYAVSVSSNTIRGLLMAGVGWDIVNSVQSQATITIGSTDGTTQTNIAAIDEDNQATTDSYRVNETTNIVKRLTTDGVTSEVATFVSFSTNNFRLNWTTDNIDQCHYGWAVVADQGGGAQLYERPISETAISVSETLTRIAIYTRPISEPSISASETLARIQYLIKILSEPSITVSETLARIATYLKPISEPSVSVSETLTRIPTYVKAISETAITSNETLARIPLYIRPISESAITTNDSIARWISVSYTLVEPSISVSDSIQGALFYLRQISESAISVNDTVARILTAIRAISEPSISTNDTVARIQTLLKTIAESAITVDESLVRIPTYIRPISESAITTNDTIATLLAAVRTLTEPSISVNDTIARIQTILKQISEDAISVNDSILAAKLLTGLIIESRVKWYYSLLTRKIAG